ncbi:cysteine--tRNA ligase [Paenibacillus sacheonensis]|uniref:Cysteine--tRNA ligase n=1 Tax=Paenibacillus sacheonensis TaxID=742054 RepID=A0A7X4YVK9_9BACL|nr:cysteine--tRNA ligase [Paenibacillus sacheonensis]MBM7569426.1 cysteinyl-tRNA synthetase [Paenibacillus sacheonensis]NBC73243.1 cysteine--tRNA ligase [Paenibacillus sacheonensis]
MTLRIYNTLTREKEDFKPLVPGKVNMYVCGPTVYDYIHIGNARPAIFFDVVRRYLESLDYDVRYVVNFTDVDDKLIRKAEQLGTTVPEVAERFIAAFNENIEGLGIHKATMNPRVTENIPEIIAFIEELVANGHAYENGGDVFFRTGMFPDYGKLSHQNLEELQLGIRIGVDERKENGQDFVLWKAAKPGEINWASPWGPGRPGWHIECSAMARKYLGETLDIHGGGHDLQFPHHECEIAQSESVTGKPLATYWMHNGYININNEKMSKSLGNGITVQDMLTRIKPAVIRYFMLSAHYRSPLNFSDETIAQAENSIERIANSVANIKHRLEAAVSEPGEELAPLKARIEDIKAQFNAKMDDDFNTPDAITAVFELVSEANLHLQRPVVSPEALQLLLAAFEMFDRVLGLLAADEALLDEEIDALIVERTEARSSKNWKRADEIRDLLAEKGIVLEDTPQGIRWRRK